MKSRFAGNDQNILCALGNVVLNSNATDEHYQLVASHYKLNSDLLKTEKEMYTKFVTDHTHISRDITASDIVESLYKNDLHNMLPIFNKVASVLASIPVTSCSAERSFSGLRRIKNYLRNTMGQTRLSSLALLNIERKYANISFHNNGMTLAPNNNQLQLTR